MMVQRTSDVTNDDRPIAGLIWRLESEGWALAEHLIIRSDGKLNWIVSGFNGSNAIRSQGTSMAEAWMGAAKQARTRTSVLARLDPPGSPWIISYDPGSAPDTVSDEPVDHPCSVELHLDRFPMTTDRCVEREGSLPQDDKLKHRGRRRADNKVFRGKDHARRTNPHRS